MGWYAWAPPSPLMWGVIGALVAAGVAGMALPWLRRGGHRVPDDHEVLAAVPQSTSGGWGPGDLRREPDLKAAPRALWLVPTVALFGGAVGWARADQGVPIVVIFGMVVSVAVLGILAVIDIDVQRLPDVWTLPLVAWVLTVVSVQSWLSSDWNPWRRAVLAAVVVTVFYLCLVLIGRGREMGLGDAKLAPALALFLGYLSWGSVLAGTMFAFLIGGVLAGILLVLGRVTATTAIPFGPAMALGAAIVWALPELLAL